MTVIAYRDGVIASDSVETIGDVKAFKGRKILKAGDYLIGTAGTTQHCEAFLDWCIENKDKKIHTLDYKSKYDKSDFIALIVHKNGRMYILEDTGNIFEIFGQFTALGSGKQYALGAMEVGADAKTAIKAAIKYGAYLGGPVRALSFDQNKTGKKRGKK